MKCLNCGCEVSDNNKTCPVCSAPLHNNYDKKIEENKKLAKEYVDDDLSNDSLGKNKHGIFIQNVGRNYSMKTAKQIELEKEDDELLNAYIGSNHQEFIPGKLNIFALLLGPFYVIYRKMWLLFIAMLVTYSLLSLLSNIYMIVSYILAFCVIIYFGMNFNAMYISDCLDKIYNIRKNNPDKNFEELKVLCEEKGGTLF